MTGAASGIGECTARELVRAGAFVWIADINLDAADKLAGELGSARAVRLDVTNAESIAAVRAQVERLDLLVNNAGIGHVGSIEATEPEDFDRLLDVNVRGVYLVTRAFLPLLLAAQSGERVGAIVNIASVAGQVGIKQRFAYCTTKGAVIAMTRQLAVEYPKTLRVNAVCPGTVETPFVEGYLEKFHKDNKEETRAQLGRGSRWGGWAGRKKLPRWCDTWLRMRLCLSAAHASPSMEDGRRRDAMRSGGFFKAMVSQFSRRDELAIERDGLISDGCPRELLFYPPATSLAESPRFFRIAKQVGDTVGERACECIRLGREAGDRVLIEGNQPAGFAIDHHFENAAGGAGHDRRASRPSLQD